MLFAGDLRSISLRSFNGCGESFNKHQISHSKSIDVCYNYCNERRNKLRNIRRSIKCLKGPSNEGCFPGSESLWQVLLIAKN
jgi:hypothetical protein